MVTVFGVFIEKYLPGSIYLLTIVHIFAGIIYCFSQKDSEQVTISLQNLGICAGAYHANMEPEDKTKVHTRWSANEIQVKCVSSIET